MVFSLGDRANRFSTEQTATGKKGSESQWRLVGVGGHLGTDGV